MTAAIYPAPSVMWGILTPVQQSNINSYRTTVGRRGLVMTADSRAVFYPTLYTTRDRARAECKHLNQGRSRYSWDRYVLTKVGMAFVSPRTR